MEHNQDIFTGKPSRSLTFLPGTMVVAFFILCYSCTSHSIQFRNKHPDPLALAQGPEAETIKILYNKCYDLYRREQHDSVVIVADQGIAKAVAAGYAFLEAQLLETKALSLEFLNIDRSIEVYLQAIDAYARSGYPDWIDEVKFEGVGNAHTILIRMYARKGDMVQAMQHYDIIESIVREDQFYTRKGMYESMAFAQSYAGDYDEAIKYFKLSILLSEKASVGSGEVVKGLEENHALIASYYDKLNEVDSARYYIMRARTISNDSIQSRIRGRAMVARITGEMFLEDLEIDSATYFLTKAFESNRNIGDLAELSKTAAHISACYLHQGHYKSALNMSEEAVQWALESSDLMAQQISLERLYNVLIKLGQFEKAAEVGKDLRKVADTLQSRQNNMLTEAFAKRYEANEKQNQIVIQAERISRQRTLLIAVGISTLLLLVLSFLAYKLAINRKRTNDILVNQRDQLAQLDIAKSNFFTNISHELKTPITLILAPIMNALEKSKNKQLNKDLQLAYNNGKKLLGLVNEILELSKLESGQLTIHSSQVNLFKLIQRIIGSYDSLCQIRKINIRLDYKPPKDELIFTDIDKLEKIVNNLISNAIKFSPAESVIQIHVDQDSRTFLKISITDHGKGIAQEDQAKIFLRYYQGDAGAAVQGGTGIGLALVYELVELMDGKITVESDLGRGSAFHVFLPYRNSGTDTAYGKLTEESGDSAQHGYVPIGIFEQLPNVLIIEDDREMSEFLFDLLSPYYQCAIAYNGQQGLERMEKEIFDCVTCDVMMPEIDGFQFIKTLRARELYQRTPVVMLTARSLEADILKGFDLGVNDYLAKPFSKNELLARINALIVNKKERDRWRSKEKAQEEKVESFELTQLKSAELFIMDHLEDQDLKVQDLASHMNYSIRQVTRIIKKLTGLSPNNFIREIRLQKAHLLISSRQFATIAEVRDAVGFQNASYFSKAFLERFGVRPGEL